MQVAIAIDRIVQKRSETLRISINEKDRVLLGEIGLGQIPTATSFVDYVSEKYGFSASGVWYTLKKLKRMGLLEFTEKGEEYRPLALTRDGVHVLRGRGTAGGVVETVENMSVRA